MSVRIQTHDFDLTAEIKQLRAAYPMAGGTVAFIGTVRDIDDGVGISEMTLEHYPGMTEKTLEEIEAQAKLGWDVLDVLIIHRIGTLSASDQIVLTAVVAKHRQTAFAACEFIMDYLKTQAPFWKKEKTAQGARWVGAKASDDAALARWSADAKEKS